MCSICENLRSHGTGAIHDYAVAPGTVTASAQGPTYSVDRIADYVSAGYWGQAGQRHFDVSAGGQITVDVSALAATGRDLARKALDAWSEVTGIGFVEQAGGKVDIAFDDEYSGAFSSHSASNGRILSAFVNVNKTWAGGDPGVDSYHFQTYLHEIGHALGLGHAGRYNGSADYGVDNHYANDSWQMSLMSYFSQWENTAVSASFAYTITPMIADIVAIQRLYGTPGTRSGDTVYGEGGNTGTALDGWLGLARPVALTLWDSGGTDLIDLSGQSHAQRVDLAPMAISDVQGLKGNLVIARGTVIENVATGSGNDIVTGNAAANAIALGGGADSGRGGSGSDLMEGQAGNDMLWGDRGDDVLAGGDGSDRLYGGAGADRLTGDAGDDLLAGGGKADMLEGGDGADTLIGGGGRDRLDGGAGDDILRGGSGADTFVFADGCGADTVADFAARNRAERIDLSGLTAVLDWADLAADHLSGDASNCYIDAGGGDLITLSGVRLPDLDAGDFLF